MWYTSVINQGATSSTPTQALLACNMVINFVFIFTPGLSSGLGRVRTIRFLTVTLVRGEYTTVYKALHTAHTHTSLVHANALSWVSFTKSWYEIHATITLSCVTHYFLIGLVFVLRIILSISHNPLLHFREICIIKFNSVL